MIITDFLLLDVQKEMDNDHLNTFSLFLFSFVLFFEKPIASIFKYTQKGKKILKGGVCRGGERKIDFSSRESTRNGFCCRGLRRET